jgi:hypothetical protein
MANLPTETEKPRVAAIVIIIVAILLMFAGFKNGDHLVYFQKAIMVCTQCIGLG